MKKLILTFILGLALCGCTKEKIVEVKKLGNYTNMGEILNEYIKNSDYPLLKTMVSFENGYMEHFDLYRDFDVNYTNYNEIQELATLEIYFDKVDAEATIKKIIYEFPKINTEILTENSIKASNELFKTMLKGLILDKDLNIEEILNDLNYPTNEEIQNLNQKYNKTKYIVYLDKEKSKKLNITYNEDKNYFIFSYEL